MNLDETLAAFGASTVAEGLPTFLQRVRSLPEPGWFVDELIPDEGIVMWHGRPRSMKSLTAADVCLSLALGEPFALNNRRFAIAAPVGVLWLGEEDPERLTAFRLGLMLEARGVAAPETFRLMIRPGWNLETLPGKASLLDTIKATATASMATPLRVLVIDPARASMPSIDGSPKDAAIPRAFLLEILRETSIQVILLPHHDTKPRADGKDQRLLAERASGGVTFSMSDCMINFERENDRATIARPTAYKLGADPKPFRVRFQIEKGSGREFPGFIRAVAEAYEEGKTEADRVLAFVQAHPWSSTDEVTKGSGVGAGKVGKALRTLKDEGKVSQVTGEEAVAKGRDKKAKLWGPL